MQMSPTSARIAESGCKMLRDFFASNGNKCDDCGKSIIEVICQALVTHQSSVAIALDGCSVLSAVIKHSNRVV